MISEIYGQGSRFGRLVVLRHIAPKGNVRRRYSCKCDCGKTINVFASNLKSSNTTSCGCFRDEETIKRNTTHGHRRRLAPTTPTYTTWTSMNTRCNNCCDPKYKDYGGRGIKVCKRWEKFENFLEDMGERPEELTLDRKNNAGNYHKSNCRWATHKEQANNKRSVKLYTYSGERKTSSQWCESLGLDKNLISQRLIRGWSIKRALETPKL